MAKKRVRALVLAFITLLCCLVLVTGATYALFSIESAPTKNHLQAGNLEIQLERISYEWKHIDKNGFINIFDDKQPMDFTSGTAADESNIFGLTNGALTAPGCEYTAHMRVTNRGKVAFRYWIEIVLDKEDVAVALADQLEVEVKDAEGNEIVLLDADGEEIEGPVYLNNEGRLVYGETAKYGIGVVGVEVELADGEIDRHISDFSVTVRFINRADNNDAMNQEVNFDLIVYAEQVTEKPESWKMN